MTAEPTSTGQRRTSDAGGEGSPASPAVNGAALHDAFSLFGAAEGSLLSWFARGLAETLSARGLRQVDAAGGEARLVVNFLDPARPRPYRRRSQATFVVGVVWLPDEPRDVLREGYPLMIRGLCNLLILLAGDAGGRPRATHFVTLEQGSYPVKASPATPEAYFEEIYERVRPLATSTLVINNIFDEDLPVEPCGGDEHTRQLSWADK